MKKGTQLKKNREKSEYLLKMKKGTHLKKKEKIKILLFVI